MNSERLRSLTSRYGKLRIAVVGDFCLDRYLEIDPERRETSIETGLPVHNVVRVRSQPGAAGTILNNLVALGVGVLYPVGFCGVDGEGYELRQALAARRGVQLDYFIETDQRRTFTYCKPLVLAPGQAPVELSRLDSKNWSPTPPPLQERIIASVQTLAREADALIIMDQVDQPETGVITQHLLAALGVLARELPQRLLVADSRRGLRGYPPVCFKMNAAELAALTGMTSTADLPAIQAAAAQLARQQNRPVFVTLAERGIMGVGPDGQATHVPALPLRGEIDVVGAGDAVTANLTTALAAGATLEESVVIANIAASIVIHQLGTTGTATTQQIAEFLTIDD
jgi:rfaE bifunctional protein kinase chain/domain